MNLPDKQIMTYLELMLRDIQHLNSTSRKAVLVNIRSYAVGLIRVIDFCLGRNNLSLNIDALQNTERENSSSIEAHKPNEREIIHAQKPHSNNGSNVCGCGCGKSLEGKRKGTIFLNKNHANNARKLTK
jgi:hypothetical protein